MPHIMPQLLRHTSHVPHMVPQLQPAPALNFLGFSKNRTKTSLYANDIYNLTLPQRKAISLFTYIFYFINKVRQCEYVSKPTVSLYFDRLTFIASSVTSENVSQSITNHQRD